VRVTWGIRAERPESLHPEHEKAQPKRLGELSCGVVNNYRTIFEDFEAVYLLGIQIINIPKII
jgi:hypothetical protein